ncbi:ferredoxin-type protein NapF [Paraglaciecola aquimarina]|uniref:Ferredoxin-type protein NapF n=1 Tax=Paraglaciecola algarum TaxID=3050085 RepID=A0ABS9D6D0_9ALTE|nr:ferredoxin-type protein NapF [Paraglaciecola sp. G1-23]MCF2947985.1 ferredoxin-type protein NapF [Paraglaciecola sp. G1-23]
MSVDFKRRAFFMTGQTKKVNLDIHLPYLKGTEDFLEKCTQCAKCIEHCPESIIIKGDGGYPTVDFKLGECTYCQKCAEHCPEPLFDLEQEQAWDLKLNISGQCFPERNIVCQTCRDECEPQAIKFNFRQTAIPKPEFDEYLCTQCGACVSSCPANAISILPAQAINDLKSEMSDE